MTDRNDSGFGEHEGASRWRRREGVRILDAEEDPTGQGEFEADSDAEVDLTDSRWADEPAAGDLVSAPARAWAQSRPAPPPPLLVPGDLLSPTSLPPSPPPASTPPPRSRREPSRSTPQNGLSWGPPPAEGDDDHDDNTDAFAYARPGDGPDRLDGGPDGGTADGGVIPAEAGRGELPSSEARLTLTGGHVLPHWTEPAADPVDGAAGRGRRRFRGRSSTEARWRTEHDDWDDLDVGNDLFADDGEPRLGALDTDRSDRSDLYSFDEAFQRLQVSRSGVAPARGDGDDEAPAADGPNGSATPIRQASRRRLRNPTAPPGRNPTAPPGENAAAPSGHNAAGAEPPGQSPAGAEPPGGPPVPGLSRAGRWRPGRPRRGDPVQPGVQSAGGPSAPPAPVPRRPDPARLRRGGAGEPGRHVAAPRLGGRDAGASRDADAGPGRAGGGEEKPARTGGSLRSRVLVGAALVVLLIVAYSIGPKALVVLAAVVVLLCAAEAFSMLQRCGFRPATLLGLTATGGLMLAAYWRGEPALPLVVALTFAGTMVWYLLGITDARPLANVAVTSMSVLWVGLLGSFAALLLRVPHGKGLFIGAVVVTVVSDIGAYFGGRRWGRHPLAPRVSPGKTVEGFVAGAGAAIVAGLVIGEWVTPWRGLSEGLALGVVVAIFAPTGDLFESLIKRDLEIKDSGTVLGGHGGLLDRFDSLLLVLPATYYLADYLHLLR